MVILAHSLLPLAKEDPNPVKVGIPEYTMRVGSLVVCTNSAYPNHAQHAAHGITQPQPEQE